METHLLVYTTHGRHERIIASIQAGEIILGRLILNVLTIALVFMSFRSAQATERAVLMPQALKNEIVTREAWGSKPKPIPADRKQKPLWITLHHAGELFHEGKDDPAEFVRKMQIWGQNRPKLEKPPRDTYWPDLPYHFLIAPDGRIFEGRPVDYEPESNTTYPLKGNIGVEMMGDFNVQQPTLKQIRSCVLLTAWLCRRYHIACDRIRTHQDVAPGQTDCPGKNF